MVRLTVVNDDPEVLALIGEILESDRHVTTLIGNVEDDLLEPVCRSEPDLVILELRHGDDARHGLHMARRLRSAPGCEGLPIVVCSGDVTGLRDVEPELHAASGVVALELPFAIDELLQAVRTLIDARESFTCS